MLEVLPDERVPDFGPGYSGRNFVLTEITIRDSYAIGEKEDTTLAPAKFSDAVATVEQARYEVKTAIDGKADVGPINGWGTGGKPGVQKAAFSLLKPLASKTGHVLKVDLAQLKPGFMLGKFRLWVTDAKQPLGAEYAPPQTAGAKPAAGRAAKRAAKEASSVVSADSLGVPAELVAALKKPADKRSAADWAAVDAYHRADDENYAKQELALWTARKTLPTDPKLTELKTTLTRAEAPVPLDPQLVQLRADAEISKTQTANERLTVLQDLAWALMNSPAFLFNR
jgi:hypothetical protein